jgi:hypothetical protein
MCTYTVCDYLFVSLSAVLFVSVTAKNKLLNFMIIVSTLYFVKQDIYY